MWEVGKLRLKRGHNEHDGGEGDEHVGGVLHVVEVKPAAFGAQIFERTIMLVHAPRVSEVCEHVKKAEGEDKEQSLKELFPLKSVPQVFPLELLHNQAEVHVGY